MNYNPNTNYQVNVSQNWDGKSNSGLVPIVQQQNAYHINMQTTPTPEELTAINQSLRTNPVFVSCPGCRLNGPSKVIRNISVINFLFWCCCAPCWSISKCCNIKEYNCFDADHYCHKCGNLIGTTNRQNAE